MKKLLSGFFLVLALVAFSAFKPATAVAKECGGPFPPKPTKVWAKTGPSVAEVTVYWEEVSYADRYAIVYGEESGKYIYGATNIGGSASKSYTVKDLVSGRRYYFRLAAARDCTSSPFSDEVSAWAASAEASAAKAGAGESLTQSPAPLLSLTGPIDTSFGASYTNLSGLSSVSGPQVSEVTLSWYHREDVDTYHLVYGAEMGKYQYGALNIGKVTKFTVGKLVPGRSYYFALVPVKGNRALYTSEPVMGLAKPPAPLEDIVSAAKSPPVSENEQMMFKEIENEAVGISEDGVRYGADIDANQEESDVQGVYDEGYYDQFSPPEGYYQEDQSEFNIPLEVENEGYLTPEE